LSEIGGDYNDGDGNDKDDEFIDDWDNKDVEDNGLDDDDDDDELPNDWDNEGENSSELDDDDDDELPDDWENKNLDYDDIDDHDDDDELPDDWNNENIDKKDLDNNIDVKFPEDGNMEKIYDDRFNEDKLNNKVRYETSRKTIIKDKNTLHINSNEKFENEPNNVSKDKLKEPINTPINAGERGRGSKEFDIPKKFCGLEPKDIMILHFLYNENFEKLEGIEDTTLLGKPIQLQKNFLTGKNLKQGREGLDLQKIPQTQEEIKDVSNDFNLSEIPQTVDEVEKAIKKNEEQLDLTKVPQTLAEVERAISEEQLDLSEIPQSMDELNALRDFQNKNIVKNSIHKLMRMSPENRESLGLPRDYTNHELDIFFSQINPLSTLGSNKANPSKVSNSEDPEQISRNDSSDGKSEDLKKKSVNKTTVKEMKSESDVKQKETSSTLNKDIENRSGDVNKDLEEQQLSKELTVDNKTKAYEQVINIFRKKFEDKTNEKSQKEVIEFSHLVIPEDLFYKEKRGYYCRDVNFLKKIYETKRSFPKIELYLKNQGCEYVPSSETLKRFVRESFKSKSEYNIWRKGIKLRDAQEIVECLGDNFNDLEISGNFFYKKGKSFHCKDLKFIKKLYEEFKSYPKIERFFREQGIKIVPSQPVIKEIVQDSFESKEKYEVWKSNIYLKRYQEIAKEHEGRCISEKYESNLTPLEFECKEGHIFKMRPDHIKEGGWCWECFFNELRLGLEVFQEIARKKGGKCISEEYVNNRTPLKFECKNDHIFTMRPDVVKEGGWCWECFINERKLGLEVFQEIARKKGGRCISEKYENNFTLLEFECKNGHIFKMRPDVVNRGGWCHECYFNELRLGLEVFQEIAREHEGRCISEKYENNYTFLEFECKKGHIFKRRPFRVKEGYWCPECREHLCHYGNLPEVNCRNIGLPKGLKQHLKLIKKTRDFPKEVRNEVSNMTNGLTNISRISAFQITKITSNERVDFEQELMNKGFIRVYNSDCLLCGLSNPKNFNKNDILGHGGVSHEVVLPYIINHDNNTVGIEIPVWLRNNNNMITGHVDLIRIDKNGTPSVIDYKPESFFHALPQVCIYGIVLKKMCNLAKLKCVIFNKDRMWEFDPELMLEKVNKLLNSKSIDCYWDDYIYRKRLQ